MRGLLDPTTVDELVAAGHDAHRDGIKDQLKSVNETMTPDEIGKLNIQATRVALKPSAFQNVALFSDIPAVVAELMQLDPTAQTLRLIQEVDISLV
jgi:hypothetical protein